MAGSCGNVNCEPRICTWEPYRLVLAKCDCVKASKCVNDIAADQDIMVGDLLKKDGTSMARWELGVDTVASIVGVAYGSVNTQGEANEKCPPKLCYFYRDAHLDCAGIDWQGATNAQAAEIIEHMDTNLRISIHENLG